MPAAFNALGFGRDADCRDRPGPDDARVGLRVLASAGPDVTQPVGGVGGFGCSCFALVVVGDAEMRNGDWNNGAVLLREKLGEELVGLVCGRLTEHQSMVGEIVLGGCVGVEIGREFRV